MTHSSAPNEDRILVRIDPDIADLIPEYLEHCREDLASARQAVEKGDHAAIEVIGHGLKGSGGGYGFDKLTEIGARLEQAAKSADSKAEADCLREIEQYLDRVEIVNE